MDNISNNTGIYSLVIEWKDSISKLLEVARRVGKKGERGKLDRLEKGYKAAAENDTLALANDDEEKIS